MRKVILALALVVSSVSSIPPANAGTLCADGYYSSSSGSGTCSWHGGIAGGAPSRSKSYGYNDPYGSSLGNSYGSTSKKNSYGYNDPYGTSGNSYGTSSKSKSYGYEDPYGTSGNSYGTSSKNKPYGGFGSGAPSQSQMDNCAKTSLSMYNCATGRK